ncbi:hypothetical protein RE2895_62140 (plasmid) [Rhodococcus erythropolis]|nr:hypothetical protein RE2895_62140 [Rhodococcus erythropolis]
MATLSRLTTHGVSAVARTTPTVIIYWRDVAATASWRSMCSIVGIEVLRASRMGELWSPCSMTWWECFFM